MTNTLRSIDERRRTWLRILLGAGALGATGGNLLRPLPAWGSAEKPKEGVHEASGSLRINGKTATVGTPVQPGDEIETGADGEAVIIIGEHAFLVRDNTKAVLFGGVADQVLQVIAGRMLSVFGEGKLEINTPVATIGIRGTAVYVEAEPNRTYACVCYGKADIGHAVSGRTLETISTHHHESPRYIYAPGAAKVIEEAPVINHTDKELVMLEWLHWRRPPFYDEFKNNKDGGY